MKHLSEQELGALLDGELTGRSRADADRHLAECAACRAALDELEAQERDLAVVLSHDPGEAYFEDFPARVGRRLGAEAPASGRAPERGRGLGAWLRGPRGLAWVGTAAALLVAFGLVLITSREGTIPNLRNPELSRRGEQVEEPSPAGATNPEMARSPEATHPGAAPPGEAEPGRMAKAPPERRAGGQAAGRRATTSNELQAPSAAMEEKSVPEEGAKTPSAGGAVEVRRDQFGDENRVRREGAPPAPSAAPAPGAPGAGSPSIKPRAQSLSEISSRLIEREKGAPAKPSPQGEGALDTAKPQAPRPALAPADEVAQKSTSALAPGPQPVQVCGVVRDASGRPVVGAEVAIADLALTTATDAAGHYCIATPAGPHTLSVMAVGFEPFRRPIQTRGASVEGDVALRTVTVLESPLAAGRSTGRVLGFLKVDTESSTFSGWPAPVRDLARRAETMTEKASRARSAERFDQAAARWEQVLAQAKGGPAELEACSRLAEARYRAWEISPTPARAAAAIEALNALLSRAPAGPARRQAEARLARLRR